MTISPSLLSQAINEAVKPGNSIPPSELIEFLDNLPDPFKFLNDHNQNGHGLIYKKLYQQFPFLQFLIKGQHPDSADFQTWVGLIRWCIENVRDWLSDNDSKRVKLIAIFSIADFNLSAGRFWPLVPKSYVQNVSLVTSLKNTVSTCTFDITSTQGDSELIYNIKLYEREVDLANILRSISHVEFLQSPFDNPHLCWTHSVLCLFQCDVLALVEAAEKINSIFPLLSITAILPREQRLILALKSNNQLLKFCSVYHFLKDNFCIWLERRQPKVISVEEETLLSQIFIQIMADKKILIPWLNALMPKVYWYGIVQKSLGSALSTASNGAITAYVERIQLHFGNVNVGMPWQQDTLVPGREQISECLREFGKNANKEKRQLLWQLAYQKWDN
ncbi:MAG: hypothetical protein QM537_02780 [Candidatus Symbiobacter sp.]|nr:hypothetical protein [Candidatus Symbiobacter sp.]